MFIPELQLTEIKRSSSQISGDFLVENNLIAIIGDEDTVVGFLIAGIGDVDEDGNRNFMVVDNNTKTEDIEKCYMKFKQRDDIDIILIVQKYALKIRKFMHDNYQPLPVVVEIPSKDAVYDMNTDTILAMAAGWFNPAQLRIFEDVDSRWMNMPHAHKKKKKGSAHSFAVGRGNVRFDEESTSESLW